MNIVFELTDATNRRIRLTGKQLDHIIERHSYMLKYLEQIKETLLFPDVLHEGTLRGEYYKQFENLKKPNQYLYIIVRYLKKSGFVITAYAVKKIR